jgi:hypothetical protein
MKAKSTSEGCVWKEGKTGETVRENPEETGEDGLDLRHNVTCDYENLLKVCASRQEKLSFCYKNSAARDAHIRDRR